MCLILDIVLNLKAGKERDPDARHTSTTSGLGTKSVPHLPGLCVLEITCGEHYPSVLFSINGGHLDLYI